MASEREIYDFIIVGGGSAGSVLANRLSANPDSRVLVLEAGRPDYIWDIFIHMPAGLSTPIGNKHYDWRYRSEPEPHMHNRQVYHARGKVLGGSSSINGMIFQRGNPLDFESGAQTPAWRTGITRTVCHISSAWKTVWPVEDAWRGGDGPLALERGPAAKPLVQGVFRGSATSRLPVHERCQWLPTRGLCKVR